MELAVLVETFSRETKLSCFERGTSNLSSYVSFVVDAPELDYCKRAKPLGNKPSVRSQNEYSSTIEPTGKGSSRKMSICCE